MLAKPLPGVKAGENQAASFATGFVATLQNPANFGWG
jgi:hypothetical protein